MGEKFGECFVVGRSSPTPRSLGAARRTAGLIDCQLCIRGNLVELLARIALAALVAAILTPIVLKLAALVAGLYDRMCNPA